MQKPICIVTGQRCVAPLQDHPTFKYFHFSLLWETNFRHLLTKQYVRVKYEFDTLLYSSTFSKFKYPCVCACAYVNIYKLKHQRAAQTKTFWIQKMLLLKYSLHGGYFCLSLWCFRRGLYIRKIWGTSEMNIFSGLPSMSVFSASQSH